MKGDFSYDRFDRSKHFNRVLKQQGRVDLDADANEQAAISQYLLRTLIVDLLGPAGGPRDNCGFALRDWTAISAADKQAAAAPGLKPAVGDFVMEAGRYYVNGLLAENETAVSYAAQPDWRGPLMEAGKTYLAYLDVWERHISYLEDDSIREVALGGPDTSTRAQTVWQLKILPAPVAAPAPAPVDEKTAALQAAITRLEAASKQLHAAGQLDQAAKTDAELASLRAQLKEIGGVKATDGNPNAAPSCDALLAPLRAWQPAMMTARLEPAGDEQPCVLPPESRYRGLENHLYRVEVHRGSINPSNKPPTFKWSRENGSVATRWTGTEGNIIRVASARGFAAGQWVELTDDWNELEGLPGTLTRITSIDGDGITVDKPVAWTAALRNPKLRRWDQTANDELVLDDGAITIVPGSGEQGWIRLEDGIELRFDTGNYRTGDYWLIPARVITGDIDWPRDAAGTPLPRPPRGVVHQYAALAMIDATAAGPFVALRTDCRCRFAPLPCL